MAIHGKGLPFVSGDGEDTESLLEKSVDSRHNMSAPDKVRFSFVASTVTLLLAFVIGWSGYVLGQRNPHSAECAQRYSTWNPALQITEFVELKLVGDFYRPSRFRGPPSPAIDDAWDELWMIGGVPIKIDDKDLWRTNKQAEKKWSRIPEDLGGGVRGYPQVFHQLHCLNTLRQATHLEYYANHTIFKDPSHVVRGHLDHCVEILRQQLMCSAEMAPILTYEVEGIDAPLPDFNSTLMCRNFGALWKWTEENIVHGGGSWDVPR